MATVDGKQRKMTALHATTMQLAIKAAKGDHRSMAEFLDWVDKIEQRKESTKPAQYPFTAADIEVIKAVYQRLPPEDKSAQKKPA